MSDGTVEHSLSEVHPSARTRSKPPHRPRHSVLAYVWTDVSQKTHPHVSRDDALHISLKKNDGIQERWFASS